MAEDLTGYFSSVFTKENSSSLPVSDAKFQQPKSDYLGPLIVTPEMVAKKIKAMKNNKSMETVQNQYTTCKSVQLIIKRGSCSFHIPATWTWCSDLNLV